MKKIKKILLKSLFFTISGIISAILIGVVSYLLFDKTNSGFAVYMVSYLKFFIQFFIMSLIIGATAFTFWYFANKVYDKLFN